MAKQIKIPARWNGGNATAVFNLGLGPCGKRVKELNYSVDNHFFRVYQRTTDGERKLFLYPLATLTGRIEISDETE